LYNKEYTEAAPATIEEILAYSDSFEGGEGMEKVETIFKWNVADIFYDFFFIANYVNLGGVTGDNRGEVTLSADEVVECLEYYQSLNEFFAIDADAVTTESVLQEFLDGKIVYTIAKTDAIAKLDEAIADELAAELPEQEEEAVQAEEVQVTEEVSDTDNRYFYGIAQVPDLTGELQTRGLSVTNSVVVNAYSKERYLAKKFARYLTYEKADDLYAMTNKMPVKLGVQYENPEMEVLLEQYENSLEVSKITDLSNYWIEMEIAFANIWRGKHVRAEIMAVDDKIREQLRTKE